MLRTYAALTPIVLAGIAGSAPAAVAAGDGKAKPRMQRSATAQKYLVTRAIVRRDLDDEWTIAYGDGDSDPDGDSGGYAQGFAAVTTSEQHGEGDLTYLETNPECSEEETEDPPPDDASGCGTTTDPGDIAVRLTGSLRKGYRIRLHNQAGLTSEWKHSFDFACPSDNWQWSFSWSMTWKPFRAKRLPCVAYADRLLEAASRYDAVVKMNARDYRDAVHDCRLGRGLDGVWEPE